MKKASFYIFISFILSGRNKLAERNIIMNESPENLTIYTLPESTPDTIIKVSKPFGLNNTECYWRHEITTDKEIIIKLINREAGNIHLEHFNFIYVEPDYEAPDYFEKINRDSFMDVNFDGFTDILIKFQGDGPINDAVDIFLFNKQTKMYDHNGDLSDSYIEKIDPKNKKLITTNSSRHGSDSTVHYFNNIGQVIAKETFSSYNTSEDTIWLEHKTYMKTINGKVIKEIHTTDTIR